MGKLGRHAVSQAPCHPHSNNSRPQSPVLGESRATSRARSSPPPLFELARASQTTASTDANTVISGHSDPAPRESIDESIPSQFPPQPEQAFHTDGEHTRHPNQYPEAVPRFSHTPAPVVADPVPVILPVLKPVLDSRKGSPGDSNLPRVKVLLCGDLNDAYSAADIKRFKKNCLEYVKGVRRRNIKICLGKDSIRKKFDWFFDPDGIAPGGLLILCVIGHGMRTAEGVEIRVGITREKIMDTFDLHSEINKLQNPCTLEVVPCFHLSLYNVESTLRCKQIFFATCTSEAIISGLDRLLVMDISEAHPGSQDVQPPSSVLFKGLFSPHIPKLSTKAIVIVWAAAVDEGPAYEEASLPGREGRNDIMIGAICRALEAAGQTIPRRMLFEKICENVAEYNVELILDGHALQAVGNVQTA
ncbi:hypothetical protein BN14_07752 [Rhizoctonia solani AG-1 IB]|uniref:Uncharacterized protein n=1 Tax=Thanatephorus cucumeris (strain AG1-IB / isolate 7/3/14) TaxID=1108050 RepID=M5CCV5_THACB|nr:hypothetical protein BN14_07752 [Rhizoctonia solani AG-1 IB]